MSLQRLTALRALMASQPNPLAAYIIPTADAHNSEYISPADARREWISGFTGSAGTAVVTGARALLWTDGRYYTQFANETDPAVWTLMKESLPETLTMEKWLTANLVSGDLVGVDPHTISREEWNNLQTNLIRSKMALIAVEKNLVDEVRIQMNDPPPARSRNEIIPLPIKYTGKAAGEKIQELRAKMAEKKAAALVVTALDEVCYVLNLRGSDIEYNPVFFAYLLVTPTSVVLSCSHTLSDSVLDQLKSERVDITLAPYESITETLTQHAKKVAESERRPIWLSSEASEAIHSAASGMTVLKRPLDLISEVAPVALMKLIKNEVELQGFRACHIRDGIAVIRFFRWLEQNVKESSVSEVQAADKLLEFRKEEADFMGPSFETISGTGPNGAVIHYTASRTGPQHVISPKHMYLLDSGGQYRDGTTDITRTRHMSKASPEQRDAFTRVLQGQMMIGSALFPRGIKGNVLDSFARKALWDVGLDYAHGTGHGVGHFLNVHEGPSGVSWRPYPRDPGLRPAQILSNEPGYYKVGEYGIRHEDLVEIIAVTKDSDHPKAKGLLGDFEGCGVLGFRTLTMVPHQRDCINVELLNDFELNYINNYHKTVLETVGPILKERGLMSDLQWLENECLPLVRA
ncbi:xaa-Pro aminopeptidase ApepP [Amyelois transitella]|uniref:xaa-Pro aminopeptidase ApepP n=1 Tax=Amyelois transitella TaxID=680683 RepID=UPI00298FEE3B|nr:xaa-Pro aminopeptidase ApepP [Amyelois transitella]XP_060808235.1 xaa-Pro aminopeptidase ApepP [Amyelois transitella]XP_060808236.1 xaa-Pro aminopeptidase ApepP [Amyelois transitella]